MAIEVTMPMLGLTMEEGTVGEWLKREGEAVQKDEPLLTVEMDKGTVEVPSPAAGIVRRIVVPPGVTVPVKTVIAEIGEVGVGDAPRAGTAEGDAVAGDREMAVGGAGGGRVFTTPRARLRARELGLDLAEVVGSGPNGRVVESDVLRAAEQRSADPAAAVSARTFATVERSERSEAGGLKTTEPLSRVRQVTAERMAVSARETARVTLFLEADFSDAVRFRSQLQPEFARLGVAKLPWDAVLARAAGLALVEHRRVLAQWIDGQGLRSGTAVNVGVAVALEPEGLVVPVLRAADTRSLRELAAELLELTDRARAGRLSPPAMQGGTFTITNLGAYRVDGFTPIVNPPETAILGVGRIADKPTVLDGKVEPRAMCTLSLSFDHRVIDGAPAAAFLARLAELLERPYALLGI